MDVVAAYLNSDMDYEVYMNQPEGHEDGSGRHCRVKKALYGFHQSGRLWYGTLHQYLTELGFKMALSNNCVYTRQAQGKAIVILTVNVDDITMTSQDMKEIDKLKGQLSDRFKMEDLGEVKLHLGLKVRRDYKKKEIYISKTCLLGLACGTPRKWKHQ